MSTILDIKRFIASRQAKRLSPLTIKWYEQILTRFSRKFPRLPRSPELIEAFLSTCPGKDERVHGYYRGLRCFYNWLERRYKISNPMKMVEPPKRKYKIPIVLTPLELNRLLSYPHEPKIKAGLLFLADTGARLGELYNLKLADLRETPWGYVAMVNGKTGGRQVPISLETYRALISNLPFPYLKHRLGRKISLVCKEVGINATAHTLRHTFATLWDGSEFALQRITGHSSFETLKLYRHLKTDTLCRQHAKFSPLTMVRSSALQATML